MSYYDEDRNEFVFVCVSALPAVPLLMCIIAIILPSVYFTSGVWGCLHYTNISVDMQ